MLMRDFGFHIYRSLSSLPEKLKEKEEEKRKDKRDEKKDDKRREEEKRNCKKDDKKDEKKREDSRDKKDDKDREKERNDDDDEYEDDETEDDESIKDGKKDRDKEGKKKKTKLYTHDPYLLLSFVYFDQTHCGYIFDKDIEELIYTLGLNLSRAQVRKLVQKVVTRDSLHYRKLTDRCKEDDSKEEKKDKKDVNVYETKPENDEEILYSLALGKLFLIKN